MSIVMLLSCASSAANAPRHSLETVVIKGYRVKGGAVVRVFRGARARRYRISGRRFCALRLLLAGTPGWAGYLGSSTIDICGAPSRGLNEREKALRVLARSGRR